MKYIWTCRRTSVSIVAIIACVLVSYKTGADTTIAIAGIAAALSGANAYQNKGTKE
jgi:hypothetical protein